MLTTLHTNDAPGAVTRLIDMGVEPFLISASLEGVLGQRLHPQNLPELQHRLRAERSTCSTQLGLSPHEIGDKNFYYGDGCDVCNNTGYKGRKGIYELLDMTDPIRELINQRAPSRGAEAEGHRTRHDHAARGWSALHLRRRDDDRRSAEVHLTPDAASRWRRQEPSSTRPAQAHAVIDLPTTLIRANTPSEHMPKFEYIALDARGQESRGVIEASSPNDAVGQLRQAGYFPTERRRGGQRGARDEAAKKAQKAVTAAAAPKAKKGGITLFQKKTVKSKMLMIFTRQLATLIDAGLPLLRGLTVLAKQEKDLVLQNTINSLADAVQGGSTFSESMAQHPRIFNKLYINMVKAGELGGVLELVLNRLAEFQEKAQKIKNKVVSAMAYPVIVLIIAMLIMLFLLAFIVPKFEQIFKDMLGGKPLPALTQWVIDASDLVKSILPHLWLIGGDHRHRRWLQVDGPARAAGACFSTSVMLHDAALRRSARARARSPASAARSARSSPAACRFSRR